LIENDFMRLDAPLFSEGGKPSDLRVGQRREHRVELFAGFGHDEQECGGKTRMGDVGLRRKV
jgi:hypothetical protein